MVIIIEGMIFNDEALNAARCASLSTRRGHTLQRRLSRDTDDGVGARPPAESVFRQWSEVVGRLISSLWSRPSGSRTWCPRAASRSPRTSAAVAAPASNVATSCRQLPTAPNCPSRGRLRMVRLAGGSAKERRRCPGRRHDDARAAAHRGLRQADEERARDDRPVRCNSRVASACGTERSSPVTGSSVWCGLGVEVTSRVEHGYLTFGVHGGGSEPVVLEGPLYVVCYGDAR